jgi:hypothetical protein
MLFPGGFTFANFLADVFSIFISVLWFWLLITSVRRPVPSPGHIRSSVIACGDAEQSRLRLGRSTGTGQPGYQVAISTR